MAFQPVPNTAGISLRWLLPTGVLAENTLYARYFDTPDPSQLEELVEGIWGVVEELFLPQLSAACALREVYARGLTTEEDAQASFAEVVSPVGLIAGEPMSNNVSFAIARRSGLTGRSTRGRIYWPLVAKSQTTNGNFMNALQASLMVTALNTVDAIIQDAGATPVIVSRFTGGERRPVGVTYPVQDWITTDLRLDTRRGRMPGNGS